MSRIDDILKLANLGYSKDEIDALLVEPQPVATPVVEEPSKATEVVKPEVTAPPKAPTSITLTEDQLNQLVQGIAIKTASGSIEMPKSTDTVLAEHFKSLLKGE